MTTTITVHDGAADIGGTKLEIRDGDTRALFDFGRNFQREGLYFEKVWPSKKGFSERFESMRMLGLLPPFDDSDYSTKLLSDCSKFPEPSIAAIFLTHAHRDHDGCIPYLNPRIPLYATNRTIAFYCQANIKLSKTSKCNKRANNELLRSMLQIGSEEVGVPGLNLKVRAIPIDHSIPGACGFFITTSDKRRIIITGDFRLHGTRECFQCTENFLRRAKEFAPDVLITEGTNIAEYSSEAEEGHGEKNGASSVKAFLRTEMELAFARGGMVLIGVSGNNIERIDTIYELVEALDATLHISVYNASLLYRLAREGGFDKDHVVSKIATSASVHVYERYLEELDDDLEASAFGGCKHLIGDYGDAGQGLQKRAVFLLFDGDIEKLGKVKPRRGSKYIHAASEAFDDDMRADERRIRAWLDHFGVSYHQIHASGHVYGAQLKRAIKYIDPKFVLPVHTQHHELFLDILSGEGRCIDGRPSPSGDIPTIDLSTLFARPR